jgi:hypothetical protein
MIVVELSLDIYSWCCFMRMLELYGHADGEDGEAGEKHGHGFFFIASYVDCD